MPALEIKEIPFNSDDELNIKRAVIYVRVSDDKHNGRSTDEQEAECRAYCERMGWPVHGRVFKDQSIGASRHSKGKRKDFQQLMTELQAGDVLVAWSDNRLHRNMKTFVEIRDLCADKKIPLAYSGQVLRLWKSRDRAWATQDATRAEAYSDDMREAQIRTIRNLASVGHNPFGRAPYGYRIKRAENGKSLGWEIDEAEAVQVQKMFDMAAEGESRQSIASAQAREDVKTRNGKQWPSGTIHKLLVNPVYAGYRAHNGVVVAKGTWEPIVSEELFEAAQAGEGRNADKRVRTKRGTAVKHLGSGIYTCGLCGNPMDVTYMWDKPTYRCLTTAVDGKKNSKVHLARNVAHTDGIVVHRLLAALDSKTFVSDLLEGLRDASGEYDELIRKATELEDYIEGYEKQALNPANGITPSFLSELKRANQPQIAQYYAQAERVKYVGENPLIELAEASDKMAAWEMLPLRVRRDIIRTNLNVVIEPIGKGKKRSRAEAVVTDWKPFTSPLDVEA
jgi:DNA invertase Pin-like site-specific DNA recombinase